MTLLVYLFVVPVTLYVAYGVLSYVFGLWTLPLIGAAAVVVLLVRAANKTKPEPKTHS